MSLELAPFSPQDAPAWDRFCDTALQATLLHTRKFLSYHRDRFVDQSLLVHDGGKLQAVFPAAVSPSDPGCIVSHPGSTYGGLVHDRSLSGGGVIDTLQAIRRHYAGLGFSRLVYKAVPLFYHRSPAQDDLYALTRLGARRTRCDLSSTVALGRRLPASERRRRSLKKAQRACVQIDHGPEHLAAFWGVLADNLQRKHGTRPVHSLEELQTLVDRFPEALALAVARLDNAVVAGTLLFRTTTCDHAQYIAATETGYEVCALDAVFESCIANAETAGKQWFDFGISTEEGGTILNDGLLRFKSEFGASGSVYEFYELSLGD